MSLVRAARRIGVADARLLVEAGSMLAAVRIALWLIPFRVLLRVAWPPRNPRRLHLIPLDRIDWAICRASRVIPRASCLTRAIALHRLAGRYGYPCRLVLGVRRDAAGSFGAHAWAEHGGSILLDTAENVAGYTPFLRWPTEAVPQPVAASDR